MLNFQIDSSNKAILVSCNAEGIATLLHALAQILGERASHIHLRASSAGGGELDEMDSQGNPAIPEVIIDYAEGG